MEALTTSVLLVITCVVLVLVWLRNKQRYWQNRGVETPPFIFPWGHLKSVIQQQEHYSLVYSRMYDFMKSRGLSYCGAYVFHSPAFVVGDIDLVKSIMQNDFQHFVDRGLYVNEKSDPLSAHLFSLEGKKWRILRSKLTPTFTSGKMKMMFETLVECSKGLEKVMDSQLGSTVDIKQILNRFTMDVIGSCAFGLDINSLENPDSEFLAKAKPLFMRPYLSSLKGFALFTMPDLMRFFGAKFTADEVEDFFMGVIKKNVEYREKNNIFRKDFMHLLIQLKNKGKLLEDENLLVEKMTPGDNTITMEEIVAQAFIFFEAGFETSSSTMAYCLFELGQHEDIQQKVRDEINRVMAKHNGQLTYEAITEMEYLERCVNETLRKYPTLGVLNRVCTKEYKVPGTDLMIERGTKVAIPVLAIHYNPDYYPQPEKFDPERFTEENKSTRPAYSYLPFGEGPRICIGMRFGIMQTKVGLATILRNYQVTVNEKSFPMETDPQSITSTAKRGFWIDYKKIK